LAIQKLLVKEQTLALIGPSGSGKSSLTNLFIGATRQKTGLVQASSKKGRHTTTHRELFLLPNGALLVDTPGLRDAAEVNPSSARTKVLDSRKSRLFKKRQAKLAEKDAEGW
jgi:putative ribosome biogenesis GTPase RsgA